MRPGVANGAARPYSWAMTIRWLVLLAFMVLASCQSSPSLKDPDTEPQPRSAQFNCDNGEAIRVENLGGSVNLTKADGSVIVLPALPDGSRSRYSEGQTALVFDGRTALFMETGQSPLQCKR